MSEEERRKVWKEIQSRDPALADFLQKTKQLFGRYELVSVKWKEAK